MAYLMFSRLFFFFSFLLVFSSLSCFSVLPVTHVYQRFPLFFYPPKNLKDSNYIKAALSTSNIFEINFHKCKVKRRTLEKVKMNCVWKKGLLFQLFTSTTTTSTNYRNNKRVVTNVLDCDIVVSEFELYSFIAFTSYRTFVKCMSTIIPK